jgi:hypothetical protein
LKEDCRENYGCLHLDSGPGHHSGPAWFFEILDVILFLLHIVAINIVVGGSIIALFSWIRGSAGQRGIFARRSHQAAAYPPFAITWAWGLSSSCRSFRQFFYTSSILMASYWIAVIPLLILAYYGIYIYSRRRGPHRPLPGSPDRLGGLLSLHRLYLCQQFTLMVNPGRWLAYFQDRSGSLLNLGDPVLLHALPPFVFASVAVAGLVISLL